MKLMKFAKVIALSLVVAVASPAVLPVGNTTVYAATKKTASKVKLNASKKTIEVGKSFTLKVIGTKSKIAWSTSNKKVATVKAGKVTGKTAGKAVITAKVSGKKYNCTVTVKAAKVVNPYVKTAPWDAKEVDVTSYTFVIPKDWKDFKGEVTGIPVYQYFDADFDVTANTPASNIVVTSIYSQAQMDNFDLYKEVVKQQLTADVLRSKFIPKYGEGVQIKNLKIDETEINLGKATVSTYDVEVDGVKLCTQTIYDVFANNYTTEVTVTDMGTTKPDLYEVAEYILNSLTLKK